MKRTLQRSWLIFIFVIAFLVGMGFLVVETIFSASDWVDQPFNGHVAGAGGLAEAGEITDRNNDVLAKTVDGKRVYNDDSDVRKSLLHTVGDDSLNISTAIQSQFRSQLTGYSFIWGLDMPQSFRGGRDLKLTVDSETCKAAYNALKEYDSGACVVYNYETGEIICKVSTKTYDPSDPPEINDDNEKEYEGVYLDNTLSSVYTPGSIFKIVTAAAAIENIPDIWERTWTCEGKEEIDGGDVTCVEAHGTVNLEQAFGHSCNIVFAELAVELGPEKMTAAAEKMGINLSYEIDDVSTAKGHYDVSKATTNELAWSGVGQYNDEVNPMQMAILCGAIANGGNSVNPTYIKSGTGDLLKMIGLNDTKSRELLKSSTASTLSQSMPSYTFGSLSVRAKTGTAEVGDEKSPNAWMVGFSTDEDCPLAFACVVEDAGFGSQYARPVAETAMQSAAQALRGY